MATISQINIDGINYKIKDTDVGLLENRVNSLETNLEDRVNSLETNTLMNSVINDSGNANLVWKKDASGVPGWRADANTTYGNSSASAAGLMTTAQYNKLNVLGVAYNASSGTATVTEKTWTTVHTSSFNGLKGQALILFTVTIPYMTSKTQNSNMAVYDDQSTNTMTNVKNKIATAIVNKSLSELGAAVSDGFSAIQDAERKYYKAANGGLIQARVRRASEDDGNGSQGLQCSSQTIPWTYNETAGMLVGFRPMALTGENIVLRVRQNYRTSAYITGSMYAIMFNN